MMLKVLDRGPAAVWYELVATAQAENLEIKKQMIFSGNLPSYLTKVTNQNKVTALWKREEVDNPKV